MAHVIKSGGISLLTSHINHAQQTEGLQGRQLHTAIDEAIHCTLAREPRHSVKALLFRRRERIGGEPQAQGLHGEEKFVIPRL